MVNSRSEEDWLRGVLRSFAVLDRLCESKIRASMSERDADEGDRHFQIFTV